MQTDAFARHPVLRGYWYAVAQSSDIAPGPLAVTVLGEPIVLWRAADGALTAARDRCPHREAPLSLGQVVENGLQCPYHGWTFGASGACVRIPSAPSERAVPPLARLTTVHATERYGLAWVSLDAPVADIAAMPYDSEARFSSDQHTRRGLARLSHAYGRQLYGYRPRTLGTYGDLWTNSAPGGPAVDAGAA